MKNYITPVGYQRLKDEYDRLLRIERPKVVAEVSYAASLGDRSENAEYIYGKKRLREIDSRMRFLHRRLAAAEIVDPSQDRSPRIFFGATVVLGYPDDTTRTLSLVGEDEFEVQKGRISWRSPFGQALMRREEGETVQFQGQHIDILEVLYLSQSPDP